MHDGHEYLKATQEEESSVSPAWDLVIGQAIIFLPRGFFFYLSFFSSPNLSCRRLDVCHTSTHGVALVRI